MDRAIRNKRVLYNVKLSTMCRVGSIAINLMLVPMMLDFLGETDYGVWLTISSLLGWSTLLDMGVGNGLKNKLAESLANKEYDEIRSYTTSVYFILIYLCLGVFSAFAMISVFVDWQWVLNVQHYSNQSLWWMMIIFFGLFCCKVVLHQIVNITSSATFTSVGDVVNILVNITMLLLILVLSLFNQSEIGLRAILVGFGMIPCVILLGVSFWAFFGPYRRYVPRFSSFNLELGRSVMDIGARFFIIQISGIILFSTDNLIISHFIEPAAVAPYHIAFRYFGVVVTFFSVLIAPIWPAFTNAYHQGDIRWIKQTTDNLIKVWVLVQLLLIGMAIASPWVYSAWVGDEVHIPFSMNLIMVIYVSTLTWGTIFVTFVNSVGKLRLQSIFSIIAAIINIPLSVLLIEYTDLGAAGVMLATIICLSYGPFVSVIQYKKIISKRANGIWGK